MFNIGPMELILILLVALVIVGPKRLPEVGRTIGKSLRELRRATDEVRYSFEATLDDDAAARPAEHADATPEHADVTAPAAAEPTASEQASPNGSEPAKPRATEE